MCGGKTQELTAHPNSYLVEGKFIVTSVMVVMAAILVLVTMGALNPKTSEVKHAPVFGGHRVVRQHMCIVALDICQSVYSARPALPGSNFKSLVVAADFDCRG